ncbi:magnesium/cobalt transporter CorA [Candidatus Micrarchaeota archaeon]|nr:magnesium/cobalt transporter CorA [Candidatus Micrarchaeota archaeon]
MLRFPKGRSAKTGFEPGTPFFIGTKNDSKTTLSIFAYDSKSFTELSSLSQVLRFLNEGKKIWINVDSLNDLSVLRSICDMFNVHSLVLEDILNTQQRPKAESYDDYVYFVLRMINLSDSETEFEQLSMVFSKNFLLTFQESPGDCFGPVRDRLRKGDSKIRNLGCDFLAYSLIDLTVDTYFSTLELIGEEIEDIESVLLKNPDENTLRSVHSMKMELIFLRRAVWPLREALNSLERFDARVVSSETKLFLRDAYDHCVYVIDSLETYRDVVSGMLDIYLSSVNNRINEVMKVLTVITTIFMPLSFIAGVYGMNFKFMPELDSPFGYPAILALMVIIGISMLLYFRNRKWI